jgi:hypothetical protein
MYSTSPTELTGVVRRFGLDLLTIISAMNLARTAAVVAVLVVGLETLTPSQGDAAASFLADARQAMGGDAALDAVRSFRMTGATTPGNAPVNRSLEIAYQAPDKFVRVDTDHPSVGVPSGGAITLARTFTTRTGLNGLESILERLADGRLLPSPTGASRMTPDLVAKRKAAELWSGRHVATKFLFPLFATSSSINPLQFTTLGRATVQGKLTDVVEGRDAAESTVRLYLDVGSHLPAMVSWSSRPLYASDLVPERSFKMTLGDYKTQDGLTWPTRFTITLDDARMEDLRVRKLEINFPFKDSMFAPATSN